MRVIGPVIGGALYVRTALGRKPLLDFPLDRSDVRIDLTAFEREDGLTAKSAARAALSAVHVDAAGDAFACLAPPERGGATRFAVLRRTIACSASKNATLVVSGSHLVSGAQ